MKRVNVYILLVFQQIIAGGTHIVAKAVVGEIDAATLTFMRTMIAAAGLWIIVRIRSGPLRIERGDWKQMAFLGFVGVALNQFLYLYGMKFSTAANGALLYAATPVFVLLFSLYTHREKTSPRKTLGILLAFVGISIVIFERGIDFSSGYAFGNLMILIAVLAWTLFTVMGKNMIVKYGALRTTSAMMICGAVMFAPIGLVSTLRFPFGELNELHWGGVLYLAIGTSIIGYLLWYHALSRIEASKVAVFTNAQPVFATILSLIFLNYTITPAFVIGSILTICAIYITQVA
ncbi:MAG: EamA family transporter [Ignavibacteriales bacterium]|nr:EamA family transporter [Ignavibacteriales bacterium]